MKYLKTLLLIAAVSSVLLLPACKKEDREPPMSASSFQSGRCGIKFTASKNINGSKNFDVSNTSGTTATNQSAGAGSTLRNIRLDATEMDGNVATRNTNIYIAVRELMPVSIDLSRTSSLPMAKIEISSYSLLGIIRRSQSGTLSVTKLTAAIIEGHFSATFDDGTTIENGTFAGKF